MAQKKDSSRQSKVDKFKEQAKKTASKGNVQRTHMIPQTEWQSDENLDLRGDLAEAFEVNIVKAYESIQKCGQIFSQIIGANVQTNKVKVNYIWNTGEVPTPQEVEEWKQTMKFMQEERQKEIEKLQQKIETNVEATQTGLVTAGGQPLTEENLEDEKPTIIV